MLYIIMGPVCLTKVHNFVHLTCLASFYGAFRMFYVVIIPEPLKQMYSNFQCVWTKFVHTLVFSYKWYTP